MSLRRSSVSSSSPSLLFPPVYPSSRYTPETTGEEEVDGPLCLASPGDPSIFFSAHRRRVNRTPRRILPTFRRHFVNVPRMSTASRSCLRRFADDSWTRTRKGTEKERERESGFDFISRMNMQPRDSHRHNYRAATSLH